MFSHMAVQYWEDYGVQTDERCHIKIPVGALDVLFVWPTYESTVWRGTT